MHSVANAGVSPLFHSGIAFTNMNNAFGKVASVAMNAIAEAGSGFMGLISDAMASRDLTITTLRYGFYGVRIPFIYMEYFVHDAIDDSVLAIAGNIMYLFGELGNFAQWLYHFNLIDLGSISNALGKVGALSSLGVTPIDASLGIISGIASVLYTIDYIIKLSTEDHTTQEQVEIGFGLAASVVHIIAVVIFFASSGALFGVTVGLTLASVALYVIYWGLQRCEIEFLKDVPISLPVSPA
jgi:hypothetical protein